MSADCIMKARARRDICGDERLALLAAADNSGRVSIDSIMSWVGCNRDEAIDLFHEMERKGEFVAIEMGYYAVSLMEPEDVRFLMGQCKGRVPTQTVRDKVYTRDGKKCRYCGCDEGPFQLDHVIPWSRGGETSPSNLVVACAPCNHKKRDRTPEEMGWTL